MSGSRLYIKLNHTGQATIENVKTIDERRSIIVRNRVFDCHLSPTGENIASSDFWSRSSIVKIVFDCRLSGVLTWDLYLDVTIDGTTGLFLSRRFQYLK